MTNRRNRAEDLVVQFVQKTGINETGSYPNLYLVYSGSGAEGDTVTTSPQKDSLDKNDVVVEARPFFDSDTTKRIDMHMIGPATGRHEYDEGDSDTAWELSMYGPQKKYNPALYNPMLDELGKSLQIHSSDGQQAPFDFHVKHVGSNEAKPVMEKPQYHDFHKRGRKRKRPVRMGKYRSGGF